MTAALSSIFTQKCFDVLLDPVLESLGIALDPSQKQLLCKINLTSVRDPREIVRRHFGESLFVAACLHLDTGTLVDIGSGGGFPGFPIAVAKSGLAVTLVESVAKKGAFLKEVGRDVVNVRVFRGRFENLDGTFDCAVSRGVPLDHLLGPIHLKCRSFATIVGTAEAVALARDRRLSCEEAVPVPWQPGRVLAAGRVVQRHPLA